MTAKLWSWRLSVFKALMAHIRTARRRVEMVQPPSPRSWSGDSRKNIARPRTRVLEAAIRCGMVSQRALRRFAPSGSLVSAYPWRCLWCSAGLTHAVGCGHVNRPSQQSRRHVAEAPTPFYFTDAIGSVRQLEPCCVKRLRIKRIPEASWRRDGIAGWRRREGGYAPMFTR